MHVNSKLLFSIRLLVAIVLCHVRCCKPTNPTFAHCNAFSLNSLLILLFLFFVSSRSIFFLLLKLIRCHFRDGTREKKTKKKSLSQGKSTQYKLKVKNNDAFERALLLLFGKKPIFVLSIRMRNHCCFIFTLRQFKLLCIRFRWLVSVCLASANF